MGKTKMLFFIPNAKFTIYWDLFQHKPSAKKAILLNKYLTLGKSQLGKTIIPRLWS